MENEEFGRQFETENLSEILGLINIREYTGAKNFVYDRCDMPTMVFTRFFKDYINYIIIPWNELILINKLELSKRIDYFRNFVDGIFSAGELIEKAVMRESEIKVIKYLAEAGLTGIGLRESPFIPYNRLTKLLKLIKNLKLQAFVKLFNVYPQDVTERAENYLSMGADYIVIPLVPYEYPGVALDDRMNIQWETLYELVDAIGHKRIVFQVSDKSRIGEIFYVFGRYVNILTDKFSRIIDVEILRARASISLENLPMILQSMEGTVSMKFIYYVLVTEGPMDVRRLSEVTHLPIKTIQDSLRNLRKLGYVRAVSKTENKKKIVWFAIVPE